MREVYQLAIDYTSLTLILKTKEGYDIKTIPFGSREALNASANTINNNLLRTLEAKS